MKKLLSTIVAVLAAISFVSTASAIPANSNMGAAINEIEHPDKSPQSQQTQGTQQPASNQQHQQTQSGQQTTHKQHKKGGAKSKKHTKKMKKESAPVSQEQKQ